MDASLEKGERKMQKEISIRWFDLQDEEFKGLLLADTFSKDKSESVKAKVLEKMNIQVNGLDPFHAWLKAMCEENGLEYSLPVPRELTDAILENRGASRFMFWLA